MLLTFGFLQYVCVLSLTSGRQTAYNVSFDLSVIFNGHGTFNAPSACNHYFGSVNSIVNTMKSMKNIFESSLPYLKTSITPSNITPVHVELDNDADYVDCLHANNSVLVHTHFVWIMGGFAFVEDYINDFYVTSAKKLNAYFNQTASFIYSHQTMNTSIIYSSHTISPPYLLMIILTVSTSLICMFGVILCIIRNVRNNQNTFIVDKALVLIIGITKFDGKTFNNLTNDVNNINSLKKMWTQKYGYDAFVSPKYCSKSKLIEFIDEHKYKLQNTKYKGVIIHIITHGIQNDSFLTSDLKKVNMNAIRHELVDAEKTSRNGSPLMKFIFYHGCRGDEFVKPGEMASIKVPDKTGCCLCNCFKNRKNVSDKRDEESSRTSMMRENSNSRAGDTFLYSTVEISQKEKSVTPEPEYYEYSHRDTDEDVLELRGGFGLFSTNNNDSDEISAEGNMVTIYGTLHGRALSTNGFFSTCICDAFEKNADEYFCWKKDFVSIIMDIGLNLEIITNHRQMCATSGIGSIRFRHVKFEKCKSGLSKLKKECNDYLFDEEGDDTFDDSLFDRTEINDSQKQLAANAMHEYNVIKSDTAIIDDRKKIDVIASTSAVDLQSETHLKSIDYYNNKDFQTIPKYLFADTDESLKTPLASLSHQSSSNGQTTLLSELRLIEANHCNYSLSSDIFDNPLIQEIITNENEYRKYVKQHGPKPDRSNRKNGRNPRRNDNRNKRNNNNEKKDDQSGSNDGSKDDKDDKDDKDKKDNKDDEKGNDEDNYGMDQIDKIQAKVEQLKNHPKYKIMEKTKYALLDTELIALVYYTDSLSACHKMKSYQRALTNIRKWKQLYYHATNGISKLHRVFHYKNKQQPKIISLYHGSTIEYFDKLSQEQLFLKTLWSFSKQFAVATAFATGSIWVIDNVYEALYSGALKGADVTWISAWQEAEVIVLPTTFYNWRKITKQETTQNGWIVAPNINVYATKEYISNQDSLCTHGDNTLSSKERSYDDLNDSKYEKYNDIKEWFMNNFHGMEKEDCIKYFKIFVDNGCNSLKSIALMDDEQDLKEIGINKKFHRKAILKEISKLKASSEPASMGNLVSDDSETVPSTV